MIMLLMSINSVAVHACVPEFHNKARRHGSRSIGAFVAPAARAARRWRDPYSDIAVAETDRH